MSLFQIVFKGEVLAGFELEAVKASAARRLKAEPAQVDRLFSGTRAVLKKGLPDDQAQRYFSELQRIGMAVVIEPERVKAPVPGVAQSASRPVGSEPQRMTSRDEPAFDPLKTQIASMPDDAPPPPPERWSQPTIAISQRHLNSTQPTSAMPPTASAIDSDSSLEPTLIVPPRRNPGSEPTMIVPSRSNDAQDAATAPTMIVPPRHSAASEPTLIVPPRSGATREPSSAASASDASLEPTMIVAPRHSAASAPTIIVRSNQKFPPIAKEEEPAFDPEKTELANTAAIEDYLAPATDAQISAAAPVPRAPRAPIVMPTKAAANDDDVQCPTCGDKQPLRVYCRRCGHALTLPPSTTGTRPAITPAPIAPAAVSTASSEETVLVDEYDKPDKKNAARTGVGATPASLIVGLIFVLLLGVAAWLMF